MTEYLINNLRTGRNIQTLPVLSGPWDDRLGAAESVSVTVDMNDPDVLALGLRNTATPGQAALYVVENGVVMAGGPIWVRSYDRDKKTLDLSAKGWASYFDHRHILPLLAQTLGVDKWTVPDPADPTKTMANPALATVFNGISLGTMAKRLVQQARTWTGGDVPIVFMDDELADLTKTFDGVDFKSVTEAIEQLSKLDKGPEMNFAPRFTADRLGVEVLFQTGTVAQPMITSSAVLGWSVTAPESPVSNLMIDEDASGMGSIAWQTGGRKADTVLVARAEDSTLTDAGYPLMELFDSSHTSVELQDTLDSYAAADVASASRPVEVWSFTVEANPVDKEGKPAGPSVGQYAVGDFIDLDFDKADPDTGTGGTVKVVSDLFTDTFYDELPFTIVDDPVIPGVNTGDPFYPEGGSFRHRIVGMSGDEQGRQIKVQCAPKIGQ